MDRALLVDGGTRKGAINDIEAVKTHLLSIGWKPEDIRILAGPDFAKGKADLIKELNDMMKVDGQVIFHYSGDGAMTEPEEKTDELGQGEGKNQTGNT